jgi:hypothetical protein
MQPKKGQAAFAQRSWMQAVGRVALLRDDRESRVVPRLVRPGNQAPQHLLDSRVFFVPKGKEAVKRV